MKPAANPVDRTAVTSSSVNTVPDADREFSVPNAAMLAIGILVIHILTNVVTPYGFHRDEFLYVAMGEHLRLWRMDFPPFIAIVARISHMLFGESLPGIRLAPAFAHAGLVYSAAFATAIFGGRRSAQTLTGLGVALCPFFLRPGGMLQPVVFDQLWWTLALLALTLRIRDDDPKHWAGAGLFLGLAALTKFSVAFLAAGFISALLFTSLRRDLMTKWPWLALTIATIVGHPSITGQITLGWPVRGQFADLQANQLYQVSSLSFLTGQLSARPLLFLAIGGVVWLFLSHRDSIKVPGALKTAIDVPGASIKVPGALKNAEPIPGSDPISRANAPINAIKVPGALKNAEPIPGSDPISRANAPINAIKVPGALKTAINVPGASIKVPGALKNEAPDYRPIAVVTATAFLMLLVMRGKSYYIAPIYPILAAAGAAALDGWSVRISPRRPTKVLAAAAAVVALYGMVTMPFGLPLLAPPEMAEISQNLGQHNTSNTGELLSLPQDYSDMLGWEGLANMTAIVWRALPPADTANAILIGTNYGRAGALDFYGRDFGLPPAISAAGSYWFFGPGTKTGNVAVVPTNDPEPLKKFYSSCTRAAQTNNPWGVPEEQSVQVYVCRGARATIQDVWPSLAGKN